VKRTLSDNKEEKKRPKELWSFYIYIYIYLFKYV
jgi:hypothetical protein